jgi:hypothetical protein
MTRPFAAPGTQTHFAPDCPVSVTHLRLELQPDLQARSLRGKVTLRCKAGAMTCRRSNWTQWT